MVMVKASVKMKLRSAWVCLSTISLGLLPTYIKQEMSIELSY